MRIVFDTESNGFAHEATILWIICAVDIDTGERYHFYDDLSIAKLDKYHKGGIRDGVRFLLAAEELSCHNLMGHDIPLIEKLYSEFKCITEDYTKLYDTFIMSTLLEPDRFGGHSVDQYGKEFGIPKPKHEEWHKFSKEMVIRCHNDVSIQLKIYKYLKEKEGDWDWSKARLMEHELAYHCAVMCNGKWRFDVKKAYTFLELLELESSQITDELNKTLPFVPKPGKELKSIFLKSGEYSGAVLKWITDNDISEAMWPHAPFTRVEWEQVNIGSQNQIKPYLLRQGWQPTTWNYKKDKHGKPLKDPNGNVIKTSPKLTEDSFGSLKTDIGHKIGRYYQLRHRTSLLHGLLEQCDEKGYIRGGIIPNYTNTGRSTHQVIVNIPRVGSFLGEGLRSLFLAEPGQVVIGWDASSLEARCAAHYTAIYDGGTYAKELLEGDVHTKNMYIFKCTRALAKNGLYALMYGCSAKKLAGTIQKGESEAKLLLEDFWDKNEGLKKLKDAAEKEFKSKGFITGLDGRKLLIRYKHALISSLFQSAGSIIVKTAILILLRKLKAEGLPYKLLGFFHDEVQASLAPDLAKRYGDMAIESLQEAGKLFSLNVEITGEYKIGNNWAETH